MDERMEEGREEGRSEPIRLLRRDLRAAAKLMSSSEARYLVDIYYQIQEFRKATANQIRSVEKTNEPILMIDWTFATMELMENTIKRTLDEYTDIEPSGMGAWIKRIVGIGPIIAAGLLAHIDIKKTKTVGGLWRFAGLDPTSIWKKGEKRPWNATLKVICWKAGESFVKLCNKDECFYGKKYLERKQMEWEKNLAGACSQQARDALAAKAIGKTTVAYAWYSGQMSPSLARKSLDGQGDEISLLKPQKIGDEIPMLPPGHIHSRAKRWTVKLMLSHFWEESYRRIYKKEPPVIYSIAMLGHTHVIKPPIIS